MESCVHTLSFRVCVQLSLPPGVLVRLEVLLYQPDREEEERGLVAMHVQSVSSWAPANIGPYSQAVKVRDEEVEGVVCLLPL